MVTRHNTFQPPFAMPVSVLIDYVTHLVLNVTPHAGNQKV